VKRGYIIAFITAIITIAGIIATVLYKSAYESPAPLPIDPKLTPGDVLPVSSTEVCRAGYTDVIPVLSPQLKGRVFAEYHITHQRPGEYQITHLIPLDLGGSNDIKNLFPIQVSANWKGHEVGAYTRRALIARLHSLVCGGKMKLAEAQEVIRVSDWKPVYLKYVTPELPPYKR